MPAQTMLPTGTRHAGPKAATVAQSVTAGPAEPAVTAAAPEPAALAVAAAQAVRVVTAAARPVSAAMAAPAAARTGLPEVTGRQRRHHSEFANGGYCSLSDGTAPLS